jgi:uncharacterized C2H2 Zn-finger protein
LSKSTKTKKLAKRKPTRHRATAPKKVGTYDDISTVKCPECGFNRFVGGDPKDTAKYGHSVIRCMRCEALYKEV